jgi:acyl carrier protein
LAFRPERWLDADARARPRLAFFPFGAGRRACVGEPFAWMEGVLVLSVLAARWRLEITGQPADVDLRITLRPRGTVAAIPRDRREHDRIPPAARVGERSVGVRQLIAHRVSSPGGPGVLADDVPIGADGLGLDSVGVVELLLDCETAFGVRLPPDLAEAGSLTVGRLVALVGNAIDGHEGARSAVS